MLRNLFARLSAKELTCLEQLILTVVGGTIVGIIILVLTPLFTRLLSQTPTQNSNGVISNSAQSPTDDVNSGIATTQTDIRAITPTRTLPSFTDTLIPTWTLPPPTNTPVPLTLDPLQAALQRAESFSGSRNANWTPFAHDFGDGVTMMLVPVGCFEMGSVEEGEQPVHEQCFDEPFWIDQTEVTRAQYQRCVNEAVCDATPANQYSVMLDQPINYVTWVQALDYCEWRRARLPKEHEWEYAARGMENWIYPWGDTWNAENTVFADNSNNGTARVGSRPGGVSWVGAMDMSGNVWEWVSSLYAPYPYHAEDGREDVTNRTDVRVLRGGAWTHTHTDNFLAAFRGRDNPSLEISYFGFRCALS